MSYQHQALVRGVAMKAPEKPLLLAIANYADEQGYCYPGIDTLAFDTGYSEPTIKRARKRLEDEGWLLKKRRWSTSNLYRLNVAKLEAAQADRKASSNFIGELEFGIPGGQRQSDHSDLTADRGSAQSDQSDPSSEITPIPGMDHSDPLTIREPVSRTNQPPLIGDAGWLDGQPHPEPQAPAARTPGVRFLEALDVRHRPGQHATQRLVPLIEALLAGDWSWDDLMRAVTAGVDTATNPPGVVISRIEKFERESRAEHLSRSELAERRQQTEADRAAEDRRRAEERASAIENCSMCDDLGYDGRRLCDHNPTAAEVHARGRERVQAMLAAKTASKTTRRGVASPPAAS